MTSAFLNVRARRSYRCYLLSVCILLFSKKCDKKHVRIVVVVVVVVVIVMMEANFFSFSHMYVRTNAHACIV